MGLLPIISSDGTIQLSEDQIKNGFDLRHSSSFTPLVLNAGDCWDDVSLSSLSIMVLVLGNIGMMHLGKPIDLSNGVLEATQGDLFTVVIESCKPPRQLILKTSWLRIFFHQGSSLKRL